MQFPVDETNNRYPWYDSYWLNDFVLARDFVAEHYPRRLAEFASAFDVLRTDPGFQTTSIADLFDDQQRQEIRQLVHGLRQTDVKHDEMLTFGRDLVRNLDLFTRLQHAMTDRVSEIVREPVEPTYNFLSLYNNFGVCHVHLDAPLSKWTVDYCVEQSGPWPIYLSQVRPWPEAWTDDGSDWGEAVKKDPANHFTAWELQEGQAIVFGGSSQWHYRERISRKAPSVFCHLLFFHFIPRGTLDLTNPRKWPALFGLPELAEIVSPSPVD